MMEVKQLKAHKSTIKNIIKCLENEQMFASAGHDGYIRVWDCKNLSLIKEYKLTSHKITAFVKFGNSYLLGLSNGVLMKLSSKFQQIKRQKIHNDCLSTINFVDNQIITGSFDAKVCFLNKQTWQIKDTIEIFSPIFCSIIFENSLYLSGIQSSKVDLKAKNKNPQKISRFNSFQICNSYLYGVSDDKGLTCISKNSNSYTPSQYLLTFNRKMLSFSEQSIGLVQHVNHMEWKFYRVKELNAVITAGFIWENCLILSCQNGKIFKVSSEWLQSFINYE